LAAASPSSQDRPGQGIGLACAEALGEAGAKVVIADRDPDAAEAGYTGLRAKGYDAEIAIMDVTDSARVAEVADDTAFAGFRRQCEAMTSNAAMNGDHLSLATDCGHGRLSLSVDLTSTAWVASSGAPAVPAGAVLVVNGVDLGTAALAPR